MEIDISEMVVSLRVVFPFYFVYLIIYPLSACILKELRH